MALFTKATKTRVSGVKSTEIRIINFLQPTSEGGKKAITIQMFGDDDRSYSITLYGKELEEFMTIAQKFTSSDVEIHTLKKVITTIN